MRFMQNSILALAILASASMPAMANTVVLNVIGTITPPGCVPTLSGGGVVDYGNIPAETLGSTMFRKLGKKEIELTIICETPTRVAITAVNNRAGTLAGADESGSQSIGIPSVLLFDKLDSAAAGLGTDIDGNKIGGFSVRTSARPYVFGGEKGEAKTIYLRGGEGDPSWGKQSNIELFSTGDKPRMLSWTTIRGTMPEAFTSVRGKLEVQAYLNKSTELNISQDITLNGLATLEMIYL